MARYGSRLKTETENDTFLGYGAAFVQVQIAEKVGPETVGYGKSDKFGRTTVSASI